MKQLIFPEMIYTALLTLIIFKVFVLINKTLKKIEKGSEK
jgi:rod shape-determining protein MreD